MPGKTATHSGPANMMGGGAKPTSMSGAAPHGGSLGGGRMSLGNSGMAMGAKTSYGAGAGATSHRSNVGGGKPAVSGGRTMVAHAGGGARRR